MFVQPAPSPPWWPREEGGGVYLPIGSAGGIRRGGTHESLGREFTRNSGLAFHKTRLGKKNGLAISFVSLSFSVFPTHTIGMKRREESFTLGSTSSTLSSFSLFRSHFPSPFSSKSTVVLLPCSTLFLSPRLCCVKETQEPTLPPPFLQLLSVCLHGSTR